MYNPALIELYKVDVNLDTVKNMFSEKVLENIKTNPMMKVLRDSKTTFNYKDKTGKSVGKYTVTPEMYH